MLSHYDRVVVNAGSGLVPRMVKYRWNTRKYEVIVSGVCYQACSMLLDEIEKEEIYIVQDDRLDAGVRVSPTFQAGGYYCDNAINAIALAVQADKMNAIPPRVAPQFIAI